MKVKTHSSEETKRVAFDLAKKITPGTVLCLYGDLGAGKTTFTQGLAEYFGIKRIISPTFVLIRQYPLKNFKLKTLYHIDLYRLDSLEEVKNLGIEEIMADKNNLVVIEWADKLKELLPKNRIDIYFKYASESEREITIILPSGLSLRGASKTSDVAI